MTESLRALSGIDFPDVGSVVFLRRVDSTNRLARHILDEYIREELVLPTVLLIALEQFRGRGRRGNAWKSPSGKGLYASLLVPEVSEPSLLPLSIPLVLCQTLNRYLHGRCRIKWPNDLMVEDCKIGGILLEVPYRGQKSPAAVLGFGVNHGVMPESIPRATSLLQELGEDCPSLSRFASDLVAALLRSVSGRQDRAQITEGYRDLLMHRSGDPMQCRIHEEVLSGHFEGIDEDGRLELQVDGSIRHVAAGEIFS